VGSKDRRTGRWYSRRWVSKACLDPKYFSKFHCVKRRFSITLKYQHMYGVLNVDEIKN
jgi:hypothetical protein